MINAKMTKRVTAALAVASAFMVTMTSPAYASDGGSPTCVENGGSVKGCYLYHVQLKGGKKERCLLLFNLDNGQHIKTTCRKISINAYVDPAIKKISVNLDSADYDDRFYGYNTTNQCFHVVTGTRVFKSRVPGVNIIENYDKLQWASNGNDCNTD